MDDWVVTTAFSPLAYCEGVSITRNVVGTNLATHVPLPMSVAQVAEVSAGLLWLARGGAADLTGRLPGSELAMTRS